MCLPLVHWRRSAGFSRGQGQVRCVCPWFTGGGQLGSVGVRVRLGVFAPGSQEEVSWVRVRLGVFAPGSLEEVSWAKELYTGCCQQWVIFRPLQINL